MSIDIAAAKRLVSDFLKGLPAPENFTLTILDEYTITRPKCFVFFYESSRYIETGRFEDRLVGNGPIMIDRSTGLLRSLGTALPVERYIEEYEASF